MFCYMVFEPSSRCDLSMTERLADTYGRGYSEAPKIQHEANVYTFQLALLLQYIGWDKVNVVGFSMVSFTQM